MADPVRGQPGTPAWFGWWDESGQLDHARTLSALPANDQDAAALIRMEMPGQLYFVPMGKGGSWYVWDGRHLHPDAADQISTVVLSYADRASAALRNFKQAVLQRSRVAVLAADPDAGSAALETAARKAWEPWGAAEKYTGSLRRTAANNSLVGMLAKCCPLAAPDLADRRPEWLNTAGGTVDLRTCLVKPHDPRDMITYCVPHPFIPGTRGTGWEQLTWHVAGENPDLWRYLIKMLGYSLLGDNREQLVFFLTGPTASGKSQVLETVAKVIGPQLAHSSSGDLIGRTIGRTRHPRVEASLAGKRFVYIDESAERISIDEGQLKRLTGASQVSVNMLYQGTETEVPVSWAIWLATNELPTVTGFDDAIRRRLRAIPCGTTIPKDQQIKGLADRLAATESEAILACLIWGAHTYLMEGEQCPVEVQLATTEYESEQNTAARFREECCQDVPAYLNGGHPQATLMSEIRKEYVSWCQATRTPMLPNHAFGKAFRELPGIQYDPNQKRCLGLILVQSYRRDRQDERG